MGICLTLASCSSTRIQTRLSDKTTPKQTSQNQVLTPTKIPKTLPPKNLKSVNAEDSTVSQLKVFFVKEDFASVINATERWTSFTNEKNQFEAFDLRLRSLIATLQNKKAFHLLHKLDPSHTQP